MTVSTGSQQASINVTPLIDVLLVLLIIFMAISPQRSVGLSASLPDNSSAGSPEPTDPVVLEIGADSAYRLNSEPVDSAKLPERLRAIYARASSRVLFVRASPELEFHNVAEAIDLAHGASVDRIALLR